MVKTHSSYNAHKACLLPISPNFSLTVQHDLPSFLFQSHTLFCLRAVACNTLSITVYLTGSCSFFRSPFKRQVHRKIFLGHLFMVHPSYYLSRALLLFITFFFLAYLIVCFVSSCLSGALRATTEGGDHACLFHCHILSA